MKQSGWLAPLFFIVLHLLRQFLFVPVIFICMVGGYLFGGIYGTVYSIVGLTLTSMMFYIAVHIFPAWLKKLRYLKKKCFGEELTLTVGQISILRLLPFMHYYLISLCLIELTSNLREYTWRSFLTNIPLAFTYTSFGHLMGELAIHWILVLFIGLSVLFYMLRKKSVYIKWDNFFTNRSDIDKTNKPA